MPLRHSSFCFSIILERSESSVNYLDYMMNKNIDQALW
ncbi:hypothetical protein CHCC20333_0237 [Bacillus paralicheniformis]|nr:hypothetical protein CHCC20333_0237 [Bacillus paralicheniformis]